MKKGLLAIVVTLAIAFSLALPAFAALPQDAAEYYGITGGTPVSGTVKTKSTTVSVSGTAYPAQATGMIRQINSIREQAGLSTLKRDTRLEEAAKQRALEISVTFSHTRPDGTKWRTVDSLANGENLGNGIDNYRGIVGVYSDTVNASPKSFMESKSHRSAILDKDFTRIETFVIETGGEMYWVQLFGAAQEDSTTTAVPSNPAKPTTEAPAIANEEELTAELFAGYVKEKAPVKGTITVTVTNFAEVGKEALTQAVKAGKGNKVLLYADTTVDKAVVGRMYINPSDFTGVTLPLKLRVESGTEATKAVETKFASWYKNNTTKVVSLAHTGALGGTVKIATKMNLTGLDTNTLQFYTYEEATNKITRVRDMEYTLKDGFLYLTTTVGGHIVVTDKALAK